VQHRQRHGCNACRRRAGRHRSVMLRSRAGRRGLAPWVIRASYHVLSCFARKPPWVGPVRRRRRARGHSRGTANAPLEQRDQPRLLPARV
jgi:hypothetical protein